MEISHRVLGPGAFADSGALRFAFPGATSRGGLLSLRSAGDMRYLEGLDNPRRAAFLGSRSLDPARVVATELHHSRRVLGPGGRRFGPLPEGMGAEIQDGLIIPPGGEGGGAVTVADCMPIWLHDASSGASAILHSGWKGTGILAVAVAALGELYGTKPASVTAVLGPAIGPCCYPVPAERARAFEAEFGPRAVDRSRGEPRLDLRAANLGLAEALGLGSVLSLEACTSCDPALGSYRREGAAAFTRMLAYGGPLPAAVPGPGGDYEVA